MHFTQLALNFQVKIERMNKRSLIQMAQKAQLPSMAIALSKTLQNLRHPFESHPGINILVLQGR